MQNANVAELKDNLSKYLRAVKQGEIVVIYERGVPIAEIHSRKRSDLPSQERLQILESKGIIKQGSQKKLKNYEFPISSKKKTNLLEALLQEREEGR